MPTKILVATPDPAFGKWLQSSLGEHGHYEVHLVQTGSEVLDLAASIPFAVAILDSDLPGEPFVPLARSLIALLPEVRLLVIPPENNPRHPNLAGLVPQGYLYRPFYLPVLLDTLESLLAASGRRANGIDPAPVEVTSPAQSWLEDPDQAARELSRLLLETGAQTALIAAEGRLWASAGQINLAAAQEAAAHLASGWQEDRPADLARYLRLESSGSEHLLYAVALLDELSLALLYDPSAPLTRAHRETARMARSLAASAAAGPLPERPAAPPASPEPESEPALEDMPAPGSLTDWLPAGVEEDLSGPPVGTGGAASGVSRTEWSSAGLRSVLAAPGSEEENDEPLVDLASVLAGMPSPDPGGEPVFPTSEWMPEESSPEARPSDQVVEDRLDAVTTPPSGVEPPAGLSLPAGQPPEEEIPAWLIDIEPPSGETHPLYAGPLAAPDPEKTGPLQVRSPRDSVPDTRSGQSLSLDPPHLTRRALPVATGIVYTCILIPERPDRYLTGDLAERLGVWVPQLCLAFGWHLSGLVVRPGYLQWTVELAPNVSPGNVVRVVRQRTSERLFSQFPVLRSGLARSDFWSPGYLAVRGPRPPSPALLEGFIRQTRSRQNY